MSNYVAIRNGGATDEQGALRFLRRISPNGQGPAQSGDLSVGPHSTPNNTVDIAVGDIAIAYQGYLFYAWADAINTLTITNNASGNPRLDAIVAYIDLAVVSSASNNNPNALKFLVVAGTPAGSPAEPSGSTIQAAVGAGNPYYILADQNVPNGFNAGSTITNSGTTIIVNKRTTFLLGSSTKFLFYYPGIAAVVNDVSIDIPGAPQAQTVTTISAYAKTGPVGAALTVRVFNVTQGVAIASVNIADGAQSGLSTTMTNPSINGGDLLRLDITGIGSGTPGSNISVLLY